MNCDQFGKRMHRSLDNRIPLDGDGELCRHAQSCESCRAQLAAWRQISSIMPCEQGGSRPVPGRKFTAARGVSAMVGLAAAMLLAFSVVRDQSGSKSPGVDERGAADPHQTVLAQTGGDLDPTLWWRSVQDRDWVDRTMPAVRSVQKGVAPLGRSLLRAVTILTTGARDQTS